MKRQPPEIELPAPSRRRRILSAEERLLWESVAKQAKPLRRKATAFEIAADNADPAGLIVKREKPPVVKTNTPSEPARPVARPPEPPALAPLGRRERAQLSRGKKQIEARLDLHGMTQARAHRALQAFLHRAHGEGLSFVLVITGKGSLRDSESERGVLRRQVPLWLGLPEFRSLVVGFEEAHIGHGGEGALYIRIRRVRR